MPLIVLEKRRVNLRKAIGEIVSFLISNSILLFFVIANWLKFLYFDTLLHTYSKDRTLFIFTFATAAVFFAPIIFAKKRKNYYVLIIDFLISLILLIDIIYFRYYTALPSIQSLMIAKEAGGVMDAIKNLFHLSDLLLFVNLLFGLAFIFLSKYFKKKNLNLPKLGTFQYVYLSLVVLLASFSVFGGVLYIDRNSFIPEFINSVYDNRIITERYGVFGAHFIDIYKSVAANLTTISKAEKENIITWLKKNAITTEPNNKYTGIAKGKNVFIIQVESLQNSAINQVVNGQEVTPNLNKLVKDSQYFDNNYFELSLGGTSDSDFVVNTSLIPPKDSAVLTRFASDNFTSLPKVLEGNGYTANAFHGYNRSFWNRDAGFRGLGYQNFYASESYKGGEYVVMGIDDKDFVDQTIDKIKTEKKPSLNFMITLSSHYPFNIPDNLKTLDLSKADYPKTLTDYTQAIHYTDTAVGELVKRLKEEGMYDNSVIVVYGDHTANIGVDGYTKLAPNFGDGKNKSAFQIKRTPLIIKLPDNESAVHHELSSTMDVMPTILNLTGIKASVPMFGRDLFGTRIPFYHIDYYLGSGFDADNKFGFIRGQTANIDSGQCFSILDDIWNPVGAANCQGVFSKGQQDEYYSSSLIKYNLFQDLKK